MDKIFIPFFEDKPACVCINGHKLVIVSQDDDALLHATSFESDDIHTVEFDGDDMEAALTILRDEIDAGIVVAPNDISPDELVESLSDQLPWIQ